MPRIVLDRLELTQKFKLVLTIAFARHRGLLRHLLNPHESETAEANRAQAIHQMAEHLTEAFFNSKHEVTRAAMLGAEAEEIQARLRQASASRGAKDGAQS